MEIGMFLGKPVKVSFGNVRPLTLNEIDEMGEHNYNRLLQCLAFHVADLDLEIDISELTTFDVIVSHCVHSVEHRKMTEEALFLFLGEPVKFHEKHYVFVINEDYSRYIWRDNYKELKDALIKQNCLRSTPEFNPENDGAKAFIRNLKKMRSKYAKALNKDSGTLYDVVSAVCAKHHTISPFNIGELTIYTIFDQFKRLNAIDNYFLSVEQLMQGAKKQDVNLKHWSAPITN